MNGLWERIEALRARVIRACETFGRDPLTVEILPVSKHQPVELIKAAGGAGFGVFGENYVQEGALKAAALPHLHFVLIGPLQRNKAKPALQTFTEIMTLDRLELAQRLHQMAESVGQTRPVWIQVDLWDEETKMGGCREADLPRLLEMLLNSPGLPLRGFMAIPPPGCPDAFLHLSRLREAWQQRLGKRLLLSMGMSDDLEEAIRAGTDQVRIGTAIFGGRT